MLIPPTRACFPCVCVFSPVNEPRRAPCEQREKKRRNYTGLSLALMSAPLVQNTTGTRGKQQPSARIPVSKPVSFPEKKRNTHRLWPAASSPPGKASQRNNQCRGRVGVPGKYCNSPTHPCSKKKEKKEEVSKEVQNPNDRNALLLSSPHTWQIKETNFRKQKPPKTKQKI